MRIYIASSRRNADQVMSVTRALREAGHEVFCFLEGLENPSWEDELASLPYEEFRSHPKVNRAYLRDLQAIEDADVTILLLPCGRSAHIEAGYATGRGKIVILYVSPAERGNAYDVMHIMAHYVCYTIPELICCLASIPDLAGSRLLA